MKRNFPKGASIQYLGYEIRNCMNNDGIVLLKDTPYEHHGNFSKLSDAKHAAVCQFMIANSKFSADLYYRLINGRGQYHSFYLLVQELAIAGHACPSEVTVSEDGNSGILFEGVPLCNRYPHLRESGLPNAEKSVVDFLNAKYRGSLIDTKQSLALAKQLLEEYHSFLAQL